jgi:Leucine-rich repeat (LRR) protein
MKLLGYQHGFINNPNDNPFILPKVGRTDYNDLKNNIIKIVDNCSNTQINLKYKIDSPQYDCLIIDGYHSKKIYIYVGIMDSDVEKLLDSYDNNIEELIINQSNILGLLDLKKFTKLKKLICSSNEIMRIESLPVSLEYLDVSFNKLKSINITYLTNLKYFRCAYNQLSQIDLPNGIEFFDCTENILCDEFGGLDKLTNLNTLNCSYNKLNKIIFSKSNPIKKLIITGNKFKTLENIPDSIEYLDCSYNPGINLDFLKSRLCILNCSNCYLTKLNNLPSSLKELSCSHNQIDNLDNLPCGLRILYCRDNKISYIDYLPDSLEVLYVGCNKFLKNLDNLNTGLKQLECEMCQNITNLDNLPNTLVYLSSTSNKNY